jgi:DNA-binding PadR family transcriptional regulator
MSTTKVEGFNNKEQKLFNVLKDGESHDIRELKKLFTADAKVRCATTYEKGWGEAEIDSQAQSFVRNSVRRLCRDGWVDGPHNKPKLGRGTYRLSAKGKEWVEKGVSVTKSAGKDKPKKDKKAAKPKVKAKTATKAKPKTVAKKVAAKPKNGDAKVRAKEAAKRAAKNVVKQKAVAASERATETINTEASPE